MFSRLALPIAVAALSVVALTAAGKPVHPPTGGESAPVQIAILADHYAGTDEDEFDYDVANFIKYGLLVDEFYKQHAASFRIVSHFAATPAGQQSRFGFELGPGDGNCAVKAAPDVLEQLQAAAGTADGFPTHFIVVANHPYNMGCTSANWSYVAVDAVGTDVLQHELGHLVGQLFDEWAMASSGTHPGLISTVFNCAPKPPPQPYWIGKPPYPGSGALPGCDLYNDGVVHAYDTCRMGAMNHKKFCYVCNEAMKAGFGYVNNPDAANPGLRTTQARSSHAPVAPSGPRIMNASFVTASFIQAPSNPPNPPRPVMRLLVDFDPGSTVAPVRAVTLEEKQRVFATAVFVPSHRRVGEFLYEISDKAGVREVGIVPDSYFKSRALRGGGPHGTGPVQPVQMFLDVPNEDAKTAADGTRNLKIEMYRIPRTLTEPIINKEIWAALKKANNFQKVAELPLGGPSPVRPRK
jgi:hypothetical protein